MSPDSVRFIVHHPFVINLGPFPLTGFGLAVLLAFVIAQIIAQRELARRGHDPSPIPDLIFAAVIGGLAGAKVYYAILFGFDNLFSRAGFVFWGGLIGGIIGVALVVRSKHLSIPRIADVAGICVAAAYSIGRSGCWAVGDDYGGIWKSRFAVAFPQGAPPSTARNLVTDFHATLPAGMVPDGTVLAVYPTQIFEVALGFAMFAILWRKRNHTHAEGWLFGLYMVLAGTERFVIEFFRAKDDRLLGSLTIAQLIAVIFVLVGGAVMAARQKITSTAPGIHASR
jgi:phosphatidylglycerol:prolipoprotein diacylglycerol transferase